MKYTFTAFLLLATAVLSGQTILTIEGKTYTNQDDTWYGVNIARTKPTTLTFRNNAITSVNRYGYLLSAGDEVPGAYNNNLDGAVITGNMLTWNGTPEIGIIPHGIFTGYNINVQVKYNYLNKVPMAIIRKSNGMTDVSGVVSYNIVKNPGVGVVIKGMNGVRIFNNTFYSSLTTAQTNRSFIDIYENPDVTPAGCAKGTKIYNNVFYTKNRLKNISITSSCLSGFECDYNIYYCESGTPVFMVDGSLKTFSEWQAMGYDTHSRVINPDFKDLVSFVPAARLDYGTDLGQAFATGLSVDAKWGTTSPATATQNGRWQVGAVIYKEVEEPAPVPEYLGSLIDNATPARLEMTFSLALANILPPTSSFSVTVNGISRSVSAVSVSGTKVTLTLASQVVHGDAVTIAYTKPSTNPLQTAAGGQAESFSARNITNNVAPPLPVLASVVVENASPSAMVLTYNMSLASIVPAASAFAVKVNSTARTVSSVAVSGTKVTLTLAGPVVYGDAVTIAYTKPSTNPLQTAAGGQAESFSARNVTNNVVPPLPVLVSVAVENASPSAMVLTYNMSLASIVPAASAFAVKVNSTARTVGSVAVSGTKVTLTLASPVVYGDAVTIAYTKPSTNPLQTAAGGQAESFSARNITNNVAPPLPVLVSVVVENASPSAMVLTYNMSLASIVPAASAFAVKVNSTARTVSSVAVSGTKVTLTLASPVVYGDAVTIAYTKPSTNPLQTAAGGQAESFPAKTVTNNIAAPVNSPPLIDISSPTKSTTFIAPATVTIDASASDRDGKVVRVEFYNGTTRLGERTSEPWSFTWKEVNEGSYSITAAATDNLGARTVSSAVRIVVEKAVSAVNLAPSIAIVSPINNVSLEAPAKVTLTVDASDPDGSITKVEFMAGGVKIGESSVYPFSFTFQCDTAGVYEITAVAWDNLNATTTSAPVTISFSLKRELPDLANLYPSPNNGVFTVGFNPFTDSLIEKRLTILSLSGRTVFSIAISDEETSRQVDISGVVPGIYIMHITEGDRILTAKRFVIY